MPAPETRQDDVVETLHGHQIADPYRWLEEPDSPETQTWVSEQRAYCDEVFAEVGSRDWFRERLRAIVMRPRQGVPWHSGGWYLVTRNDGQQDQDVWYAARTLDELLAGGRVVVDPNTLSEDGTTSVHAVTVAPDGRHMAVAVSAAGSDWTTFRFLDTDMFTWLDDEVTTKFAEPTWLPDSRTVLWSSWPDAGRADGTETTALAGPHLRAHTLGDPITDAPDLLSFPEDDQLMAWPVVFPASDAAGPRSWLVVHVGLGTEAQNNLLLAELTEEQGRTGVGPWSSLVCERTAEWMPLGVRDGALYVRTDDGAERGRIVTFDLAVALEGPPPPVEVLPEGPDTLEDAAVSSECLVVATLSDVTPRLRRVGFDGTELGDLPIGGGALVALHAEEDSAEVFCGVSSVTTPTTSYRVDAASGEVTTLSAPGDAALEVVGERHRAISADGTEVPYFLLRAAGTPAGEPRATLLYGYGGFSIPVQADFRPGWGGWLAAGGVLVIANLRGGGEFGTSWATAGKKHGKQRVFDDVIAVAEHLIASGVTTSAQLAIHGRSNGGLLVGAAMTQRPELFACALPQVGVLDCLRFHRFTIGAAWISDYGDPDDADDFASILAWSPLQNVRPGTPYPPTLVVTGDHDDRVVPAHSYKFAAALQAAQGGDGPIACRIEVATGHGMGKPLRMLADEWADVLAFAAEHTGLVVSGAAGTLAG